MASGGNRLLQIKVESAKNGPTGWSAVARLLTPALYEYCSRITALRVQERFCTTPMRLKICIAVGPVTRPVSNPTEKGQSHENEFKFGLVLRADIISFVSSLGIYSGFQ